MKNKGKWQHRFSREPLEKRFAEVWEEEDEFYSILEYLLSNTVNERDVIPAHDRQIAATVIQWLGSTCGMAFLSHVLKMSNFKYNSEFREHIRSVSESN